MEKPELIEQFDLRSKLRFNIDQGQIWLEDKRMLLLHAKSLAAVRYELIKTLGARRAQGLLMRMGYASGQQDADLATKLFGEADNVDVFKIGPILHAFEGYVDATVESMDVDWEQGAFFGEVRWEGSWEAEAHVQHCGQSAEPACWNLVGYASGFSSRFFKRFIVFRETQCMAQGHDRCVVVGKPAEAWNDEHYISHFKPESGASGLNELREELAQMRGEQAQGQSRSPGRLIGSAPAFKSAFDLATRAAGCKINVLLLGETGVGKEVFARWLHENSSRADKPFIAINCGAIPHDLIESELFGVRKGAFTGAQESRPGRFERADGGTLFLDEVGDLSPAAQVKLLRVLQTGEVERLGDDQLRKVDVRVIAATNVDLQQAIAEGRFRADLYYRLATYPITIPALRDRRGDIPVLANALLEKYREIYQKKSLGLSDRALQALMAHHWPGNVREMENLIERAVLLAPSAGEIEVQHLFPNVPQDVGAQVGVNGLVGKPGDATRERVCEALLRDGFDLESHERQLVELAVRRAEGNLSDAARALGLTRRQLAYRLKKEVDEIT